MSSLHRGGKLIFCLFCVMLLDACAGQTYTQCIQRFETDVRKEGAMTCDVLKSYTSCVVRALQAEETPNLSRDITNALEKVYAEANIQCDIDVEDLIEEIRNNPATNTPRPIQPKGSSQMEDYYRCRDQFLTSVLAMRNQNMDAVCDRLHTYFACVIAAFDIDLDGNHSQRQQLERQMNEAMDELGITCQFDLDSLTEHRQKEKNSSSMYFGGITAGVIVILVIVGVSTSVRRRLNMQHGRPGRCNNRPAHPVTVNHLGHVVYNTADLPPGVTYKNDMLHPAPPPSYAAEPPTYDDVIGDIQAGNTPPSAPPNYTYDGPQSTHMFNGSNTGPSGSGS